MTAEALQILMATILYASRAASPEFETADLTTFAECLAEADGLYHEAQGIFGKRRMEQGKAWREEMEKLGCDIDRARLDVRTLRASLVQV